MRISPKVIGAALLAIFGVAGVSCGTEKVPTGYVGVVSVMGSIKNEELPPGIYQVLTRKVVPVSIRETTISMDNLRPKTANNVTMQDVDIDVRYMIQPNKVAETQAKLAGDVSTNENGDVVVGERYLKRFILEAVYKAVSKYPADTIHTKREELGAEITTQLQKDLNKAMPHTFLITGTTVRQLLTDPRLEEAIRKAAQMEFEIARAKEQKELAEAQAAITITKAHGEAEANRILAASLTPNLIRKMEIESQSAFANQGTHTVLMGGNASPLINVGK